MTARVPPCSTNRHAASTLGPIEPLAKCPCAASARSRRTSTRPIGSGLGGAEAEHRVRDVGDDHQHVGGHRPGQQHRSEVLVDHRLDPAQARPARAPPGSRRRRSRPPRSRPRPGRVHGSRVQDLQRLRGGHHPPPAPGAAVLPGLAVLDRGPRPAPRAGSGRSAWWASRSRGRRRPRGVRVTTAALAPVDAARPQRVVQRVHQHEADRRLGLRPAPVQRHRRDDGGGELVLHQQVADLRTVAVRDDHVDAAGDEVATPRIATWRGRDLRLRPGTAVRAGHRVAPQGQQHPHRDQSQSTSALLAPPDRLA